MKAASPYLDSAEAAAHLHFDKTAPKNPVKAFHAWRYRHPRKLKTYRRGARVLFKQHELDAAVSTPSREKGKKDQEQYA